LALHCCGQFVKCLQIERRIARSLLKRRNLVVWQIRNQASASGIHENVELCGLNNFYGLNFL
jgi:hypothetical protein